mgnify:CR=1 FL=1
MMDKSGTEITVGCRVTEADLGFGDGTVESVEVPAGAGGFNVGVHWDEPDRDGPGWSDEGGGRRAEHLLVIEAAPPRAETTGRPDREFEDWELKRRRFKERFGRSPTASQGELSAADWDELSGEESGSEEGGRKESGEGGGGNEDYLSVVKTGSRVKLALFDGNEAAWHGALVGEERDDGDFVLGFDDGEVRLFTKDVLISSYRLNCLAPATAEEGGIVENTRGYPTAAKFVTFKQGQKSKVIGLLVGCSSDSVAEEPIYLSFHIQPKAFDAPKRTRSDRRKTEQSLQDRQGWHTFRRSDLVEYAPSRPHPHPHHPSIHLSIHPSILTLTYPHPHPRLYSSSPAPSLQGT